MIAGYVKKINHVMRDGNNRKNVPYWKKSALSDIIPPIDDKAVVKMHMTLTILGLGSNLGDRAAFLEGGALGLAGILKEMRRASVYKTAPLQVKDQEIGRAHV
jgi:hypothetical protein